MALLPRGCWPQALHGQGSAAERHLDGSPTDSRMPAGCPYLLHTWPGGHDMPGLTVSSHLAGAAALSEDPTCSDQPYPMAAPSPTSACGQHLL